MAPISLTDKHVGRLLSNQKVIRQYPGLAPYVRSVAKRTSCCGGGVGYRVAGGASAVVRALVEKAGTAERAKLKAHMGISADAVVKFYKQDSKGVMRSVKF